MSDIKVTNVGASRGPASARKTRRTSELNSSFSDSLREVPETADAGVAASVGGIAPVGGIISVQEVGDATDGRSKGLLVRYGDELLDQLEDIRLGILTGSISKDRLAELAQKMRQKRQEVDDPRLNEIIDEIELRSEVEIAKLTRGL